MNSIIKIGGVLVKCKNEVLLCKRAPDKSMPNSWSIPCGHLEKGESPEEGAKREFFEETNLNAKNLKYLGKIEKRKLVIYVYLMEVDKKVYPDLENAKDGFEHTDCDYFSLNQLPIKKTDDQLYKLIKKVLS